jgi:cbb3-type cytochrome oxidase cytochrome c subunit
MNKSPWIFLGVLFALSLSWWGMVYGPASQVNNLSADLGGGDTLKPRVGLAKQGEQVYRENGCYYCHTRAATGGTFGYEIQITQLGDDQKINEEVVGEDYSTQTVFKKAYAYKAVAKATDALKSEQAKKPEERDEVKIVAAEAALKLVKTKAGAHGDDMEVNLIAYGISGVNFEPDLRAQLGLPAEMDEEQQATVAGARFAITDGTQKWNDIEGKVRRLRDEAGAQFKLQPVAKEWPDVQRGARRQSVSRDFLFDAHAMVGVMRVGPDLSSHGSKIAPLDENGVPVNTTEADNKFYKHLYDPQWDGQSSHMPPFRYLFRERTLDEDALAGSGEIIIEKGDAPKVAIIPTAKARALLAYMKSLRTDKSLPEAPLVNLPNQASAE